MSEGVDVELELLRRACRSVLTEADDPLVASLAEGDVDWSRFLAIASENRMSALAARGLEKNGAAPPPAIQTRIEHWSRQVMAKNARALKTLRDVVPQLAAAGVNPVVFKGPLQQILLYDNPFVRPSTDIDILVETAQFHRASVALRNYGYALPDVCASPWWRTFLGEQHFVTNDPTLATIDLHHKLQQPGCPRPRRPEQFHSRAERSAVGGATVSTLAPLDAALLACMSLCKALVHREAAGHHAADIVRLLAHNKVDPAELAATARDQGLARTLALGVQAAGAIYGPLTTASQPPFKISDGELLAMVLAPASPSVRWPRRSALLWRLCDRGVRDFAPEAVLRATAEACRHIYSRSPPERAARPA